MERSGTSAENKEFSQKGLIALDKAYSLALNGVRGVSEPLDQFAGDYISQYGRTEKAIDKMVLAQELKLASSGFVTNLGGLLTLPIALPADLASSLYIEMRLIAAIAHIRGYNIYSDEVKTLVYLCLVGNAVGDVLKQVGVTLSTQFVAKKLLPKLTRELIGRINKTVCFRLLTKGGTKGIINLNKAVPLIGGIVGGTYNCVEVAIFAKWAKKMFEPITEENSVSDIGMEFYTPPIGKNPKNKATQVRIKDENNLEESPQPCKTTQKRPNMEKKREKFGLMKYVYVDPQAFERLQELTTEEVQQRAIDQSVENTIKYYNGAGYDSKDGEPTPIEVAKFLRFETPYKDQAGKLIYGWAVRDERRENRIAFNQLTWGSEEAFAIFIKSNKATKWTPEYFEIGRLQLQNKEDANRFLRDLATFIIEEDWTFGLSTRTFDYPILKTYIEHTLDRLVYEYVELGYKNKLVFSKDGKYVAFNTNLLSKSYGDVIIVGKASTKTYLQELKIYEPEIVKGGNRTYVGYGFEITREWESIEDVIAPPCYFSNINEVIFDTTKIVDKNDEEHLIHILEERRFRWPKEYKGSSTHYLAQELKKAIDHAVIMARRNYKYIVPMYYPEPKRLQFLMPLYFDENTDRPAGILILNEDKSGRFYTPTTSITFEMAYQDARLIVKPESSWLNPKFDK